MKNSIKFLIILLFFALNSYSQSVDEIIENYYENTGGIDKWKELQGVKMLAKLNQQGMEIPIELIQLWKFQNHETMYDRHWLRRFSKRCMFC